MQRPTLAVGFPIFRRITPINVDNLFVIGRRPISATEEPTFMTRFQVEVMLKREKEKAIVSLIYLDLQPPNAAVVAMKLYPVGYYSIVPEV